MSDELETLTRIARGYGYLPAARPGHDEARYCFSSLTHIVLVTARHELFRSGGEAPAWAMDEFRGELEAGRDWCELATGDEVAANGRIELRPLARPEPAEYQQGDELVSLHAPFDHMLHEPNSWPVLAENPEAGG